MKEQGEEELLRVSGARPRCTTSQRLAECGCRPAGLWLSGGSGLWPRQQRGANASLHKKHKSGSLDSNGLGHQDSRAGRWSRDRLVVLGRKRGSGAQWRGDFSARRKGLGATLQPKHRLRAPCVLIPITITVPLPCLSRLCNHLSPHVHLVTCIHPSCPVAPVQPPPFPHPHPTPRQNYLLPFLPSQAHFYTDTVQLENASWAVLI